jgi:hypothetical protein
MGRVYIYEVSKIGVSAAQASVDFHGPTEYGEIKHKRLANTEILPSGN